MRALLISFSVLSLSGCPTDGEDLSQNIGLASGPYLESEPTGEPVAVDDTVAASDELSGKNEPVLLPVERPRPSGRLPPDFRWGRCLLEVEGKQYIQGRCAYHIGSGGLLEIHGPQQVWSGIDYPEPEIFSSEISTDYFAQIDVQGDEAEGLWNGNPEATHAHRYLGRLTRRGACWVSSKARVCAWEH